MANCLICGKPSIAKGLCYTHYEKQRLTPAQYAFRYHQNNARTKATLTDGYIKTAWFRDCQAPTPAAISLARQIISIRRELRRRT